MAISDRLRKAYPKAAERTLNRAEEALERANITRAVKSSHFQALAARLEQAYPGIRKAVDGPTAGHRVWMAMAMIADPAQNAKVAKLLGGRGTESREAVLGVVADALGAESVSQLQREVLAPMYEQTMADELVFRSYQHDAEAEAVAGVDPDHAVPALSANRKDEVRDESERRSVIENAMRATPAGRREGTIEAHNDRAVDVAKALSVHAGEEVRIDPESPGMKAWAERYTKSPTGLFALQNENARLGTVREGVQRDAAEKDAYSRTIERDPYSAELIGTFGEMAREHIPAQGFDDDGNAGEEG